MGWLDAYQGNVSRRVLDLVGDRVIRAELVEILGTLNVERLIRTQAKPSFDRAPNLVIVAFDRVDGLTLCQPNERFVWRQ